MTVADLIHHFQLQDPRAIVVLPAPPVSGLNCEAGRWEVQPVRLRVIVDLELVWLQIAEDGPLPVLLFGDY